MAGFSGMHWEFYDLSGSIIFNNRDFEIFQSVEVKKHNFYV